MPMRNPLAGLVRRNPEAPTLRQRAASLRAAAARVIRKPVAAPAPAPVETTETALDPIFAAMAESRALQAAKDALYCGHLPDAAPEWGPYLEAYEAWGEHLDGVLTETVPTTAAGCVALARFAVEFHAEEGVSITAGTGRHDENLQVLRLIAQSPALTGAPLPGGSDPVLAAIDRHRASREALNATCDAVDKYEIARQGGDTSDEAMAAARAINDAADAREVAAWNAVFQTAPASLAGLLALIRYAAEWADEQHGVVGAVGLPAIFKALGDGCADLMRQPTEVGAADALVDAIERGWAEWTAAGAALRPHDGPDADARVEAINRPRYALIAAAEALPATSRAARHAKALAYAWWDAVEYEAPGLSREDCGRGGRLVFDIGAALTASRQDA